MATTATLTLTRNTIGRLVLAAIIGLPFAATTAEALSLREYATLSPAAKAAHVRAYIERVSANTDPKLAADLGANIRTWFFDTPAGKTRPLGIEKLDAELLTVNQLARQKQLDMSQVQIEGVINKILREQFPVEIWVGKTPAEREGLRRQALRRRLDELERASAKAQATAEQQLLDVQSRAMRLSDGRRFYPDANGNYFTEDGKMLVGKDLDEARAIHQRSPRGGR